MNIMTSLVSVSVSSGVEYSSFKNALQLVASRCNSSYFVSFFGSNVRMPFCLQDTVECLLFTAPSAELNQHDCSNPRLQYLQGLSTVIAKNQ